VHTVTKIETAEFFEPSSMQTFKVPDTKTNGRAAGADRPGCPITAWASHLT